MLSLTEVRTGPRQQALPKASEPIAALIALEPQAWQDLFEGHFRKMYNFAYVRTGDAHLAEEIASEVFAAAARAISRYRDTGAPIGAWLYRIARNITADYVDRRARRPVVSIDTVQLETENLTLGVENAADLAQCVARLTREQQEVIALRFYNDCSLQEAAAALGKSVGAVKLLQHRALAALRRHLDPEATR
ncbi:MAG TPA: RNA polymerase sigma factor [Dehalococcoidia bacterium]|nr:RNA polymerase sigma factor [Dehalococcoidia bacterium]